MKYLVVDDERLILKDEVRMLHSVLGEDNEIFAVDNSEEALEIVKRERPYVVFLDVNMPDVDGFELSKKIVHDSPESNIVFVTGYGEHGPEISADVNVSSVLLKPVTKIEIQDAMLRLRKPRI